MLLRHGATLSAAVRYFLFKVPLMITQLLPAAALVATLLSLGLLARRNEITALRASGVSLWQTAQPLLGAGLLISVAALAWDEFVVPGATQELEFVYRVEIKKQGQRSLLSGRQIWYQGRDGFYHIDLVDMRRNSLYGLTIYRMSPTFEIDSIVEIDRATWMDGEWQTFGVIEHRSATGAEPPTRQLHNGAVRIEEPIDDFREIKRKAEELSYAALRERIDGLRRKGIDASHYLVDLNLKLALPFASLVLTWIGIPIGGAVRRNPNLPQILAGGMAVGFSYWVILGFARSLGESGVLDPVLSAWAANGILALVGLAVFLKSE